MLPSKSQPPQLAIFGEQPAFAEPLHVGRPNLPDKQAILERISGVLDRNWLTNGGPLVQEFEQRVATEVDVRHCVAVTNGTVALELAIRALDLSGEAIVPAFTFIATAHALAWQGVTPVFCDVDPETHAIDPRYAARLITPRTTALVGVHLWGRGCDVEALAELAGEHRLSLLFDAAHAFGCTHQGRPIGGFGDCEVFSFHATKFLHSGEGGAVTTNDDDLARRLRLMRNFGFAGMDHVATLGINGKMSEFAAAVGLTSLDHKARIVAANRENYDSYRRLLAPLPGLKLLPFDPGEKNNYQYVVVEVDEAEAGLTRDEFVAVLFADNVLGVRRYFYPGCHRAEPYCSASGEPLVRLPATESLARSVFALPTGMQLDERAITTIVELLETAIANAAMVRGRLHQRRAA